MDTTPSSNHPAAEADVPSSQWIKRAGLIAGPLIALFVGFFVDLGDPVMTRMAAVAILMSIWWITEALPLGATGLLPLVLFPALGIMNGKAVSKEYGNWIIYLFIGGFLIALAMERWNLHRRIALNILSLVGGKPLAVLFGFMAGTAFLSMWISNTATTMMMVPIAMAILVKWEEFSGPGTQKRFASSLMLGIAYAASIGGIGTLVGTPPNTALVGVYTSTFPERAPIAFGQWMLFAVPVSLIMFAAVLGFLALRMRKDIGKGTSLKSDTIREELRALGAVSREEKMVFIVFLSVAVAWVFRQPLNLGFATIPGWSSFFGQPSYLNDGTVAIAFALILFMLPARDGGRLLDVSAFPKLPWGIVLLFGGGFALAAGFKESGLSLWVGGQLSGFGALPLPILIGLICLIITFLTEVTSNTASAQILLPLLAGLAIELDIDPLLLMVPGAISCSCAFMLPVATPPNAIVFATERVSMKDMVLTGVTLNLIGVIIITIATIGWGWILIP